RLKIVDCRFQDSLGEICNLQSEICNLKSTAFRASNQTCRKSKHAPFAMDATGWAPSRFVTEDCSGRRGRGRMKVSYIIERKLAECQCALGAQHLWRSNGGTQNPAGSWVGL